MSFWQQLNGLLSETPGNLVYHLVTLFAIQATLAISLAHWRREQSADALTRRLAVGAGALLLARVVLLGASLWLLTQDDRLLAARVLPPLEQAINTLSALIVVWIVTPRLPRVPRLQDALAVLVLLLIGVVYVYFAQSYEPVEGATYNASPQSYFWGLLQLALLALGGLWIALRRFPSGGLRFFPVLLLFLGHLIQVWDFPERAPGNTEITFWIRLGHLAAFPLLAVLAYRHTMQQLLAARLEKRPALEQLSETLRQAARVVAPGDPAGVVKAAARMAYDVLQPAVAGVALPDPEQPMLLQVVATQGTGALQWDVNGEMWPAVRLTMEQQQPVELLPNGVGARQLRDLYAELDIRDAGAMVMVPMQTGEERPSGVLFAGAPATEAGLSAEKRAAMPVLAGYFATLLARLRPEGVDGIVLPPLPPAAVDLEELEAIGAERDEAVAEAGRLREQLEETEGRLTAAQQQARDLAATVEALENGTPDERVQALEEEIAALREALHEAEEAMEALAKGELNAEWVTMTISRYSGELEAAMTRIAELEIQLAQRQPEQARALMTALAQELRTPLTSIGGYTDLLLSEAHGILVARQRDFLERVRANIERIGLLLDQIVQVAAAPTGRRYLSGVEQVQLHDLVDVAVNTVMMQMRRKSLRLYLDIPNDLPAFPANRDAFGQALIHLLSNASQASLNDGIIAVRAHVESFQRPGENGHGMEEFLHLSVQDSGEGIPPEKIGNVFDVHQRTDNLLIPGLGDTGAGLQVAHTLVDAHGGRIWVESQLGVGSTFTVVMPLAEESAANGEQRGPEARG